MNPMTPDGPQDDEEEPQGAPQQEQPAAPEGAQGGQQPGGDGDGQNQGPQPVEDIGFDQDVQNILWSRVQTLNQQEVQILDQIVTPQSYPVLVKMFPELKPLLDQATTVKGAQQGPIQGQQAQQPAQAAPINPNVSRGLIG